MSSSPLTGLQQMMADDVLEAAEAFLGSERRGTDGTHLRSEFYGYYLRCLDGYARARGTDAAVPEPDPGAEPPC